MYAKLPGIGCPLTLAVAFNCAAPSAAPTGIAAGAAHETSGCALRYTVRVSVVTLPAMSVARVVIVCAPSAGRFTVVENDTSRGSSGLFVEVSATAALFTVTDCTCASSVALPVTVMLVEVVTSFGTGAVIVRVGPPISTFCSTPGTTAVCTWPMPTEPPLMVTRACRSQVPFRPTNVTVAVLTLDTLRLALT